MISGSRAPRTPGTVRNAVLTFSVAVIVYRCELPALTPAGTWMAQARYCCAASQAQVLVVARIPGPARVMCTSWAAANALAVDAGIALPVDSVSRKCTVITRVVRAKVAPLASDRKPVVP